MLKAVFISLHETFLTSQHVLLGLRFNELSWDHSYPEEEGDSHILWLEFDGEEDGTPVNKLLKIYSKQVRNSIKFTNHLIRLYFTPVHTFNTCVIECHGLRVCCVDWLFLGRTCRG